MKEQRHGNGEKGFFAALGLFALVCLAAALNLLAGAPRLSGEGTVPTLCALVMLAAAAVLLLAERGGATPGGDRVRETLAFLFPGKVGPIVVYCLVYGALLGVAGFAVSSFLFLALSLTTLDGTKKVRALAVAAVTVVCVLVVFQYIFQVRLP